MVKISGFIMSTIGVIGTIYSIITISNDKSNWLVGYTYTPPFTEHETIVLAVLVVLAVLGIVGIVLLSAKEEDKYDGAERKEFIN